MSRKSRIEVGLRVREARKMMSMTTTVLAKKVKISQAQISRLENGLQGFRQETLESIAKALKVNPAEFFMKSGEVVTAF